MSKNIKNDRSECYIYNFNHREDSFYMAQVVFNDGKLEKVEIETDIKGYYLMIVNVEYDIENGIPYNPNMLYSDLRLLVQCERRSEKNFNIALEKMEEVARESVEIMEADKEYFRNIAEENGIENVDEMINKIMEMMKDDENLETEKNELMSIKEQVNKNDKNKKKEKKVTFDDIAGLEDVKEVMRDVIDQFKYPEKYEHFDIPPYRSLLLHGQPGTGKTYIANAFANEMDAKFIKVSLGEMGSKYQNETGNNIKKLFDNARKENGNVILLMDEVDSLASKRGDSSNDKEKNNTLNTLLQEMSSDENDNIFIICATNFYELLDPAFCRVGRIDVTLEIPLPDFETRLQVLKLNTRRKPLAEDVCLEKISELMDGKNCADMAFICNQSARIALKKDKMEINQEDFMEALEKMSVKKEEIKVKKIGFELNK